VTASQSSPARVRPDAEGHEPPLSAPLKLQFDYTRSVGPVLGRFFTELRGRHVVGIRGSDGRVHVPPPEYDPVTYEPLSEIVPVASVGTVVSWSWQPHPLDAVSTGARVHVHWADEPVGAITDIAYFALGDTGEDVPADGTDDRDPVTMIVVPTELEIQHTASHPESTFLRALEEGRLVGARAGAGGKVYFPAREADPATGQQLDEYVELPDTGTVTTFAIINIPFAGQRIKPPYVAAYVLLDGADIPFLHLVTEIDAADVRMGMRVEAVWKPREEWGLGIDNIDYFRPTGEPDADYETYKHHQ
jgi:uncharacterized protein